MDSIKQILILEDHKLALQILCDVTSEIFANAKIKTAVNISQAQQLLTQQKFDLALIDIALPDGNGIDIVKLINHQHPTTKIVITTILADDETIFNSLKAGAFGYLLKGYSKDELKEYLLKMLKGQPPISPTIAVKILSHFHQNNDNSLTKREKQILSLIAKGLKVKAISTNLHISESTVATHIKTIYKKLGIHSRAEATKTAIELNLI